MALIVFFSRRFHFLPLHFVFGGRVTLEAEGSSEAIVDQRFSHPPSILHYPPSTLYRSTMNIHPPPSTLHYPPSTIHRYTINISINSPIHQWWTTTNRSAHSHIHQAIGPSFTFFCSSQYSQTPPDRVHVNSQICHNVRSIPKNLSIQ